jgi:hypothetical protein
MMNAMKDETTQTRLRTPDLHILRLNEKNNNEKRNDNEIKDKK